LEELQALAERCRTPKRFRALLRELRRAIRYRRLICGWGYPAEPTIGFIFNDGAPAEFLRWYLSKGMLKKGPMFHEWLRTRKTQVWRDVVERLRGRFDPELLDHVRRANLEHCLAGGVIERGLWVHFVVDMGSEQACRRYVKPFGRLVPGLCRALARAC